MANPTVLIGGVRVPPELYEKLCEYAESEGLSRNSAIIEAIEKMLGGEGE